jgi:hypothetical protein
VNQTIAIHAILGCTFTRAEGHHPMKNVPTYEIDRLSHSQMLDRRLETELKLAQRMSLPVTSTDLGIYVEQLLSSVEEEVCKRATD